MPRIGHPEDNTLFGASNDAPNSVFSDADKKYMSTTEALDAHYASVIDLYKNENERLRQCIRSIRYRLSESISDDIITDKVVESSDKYIKIYNLEDIICGGQNQQE